MSEARIEQRWTASGNMSWCIIHGDKIISFGEPGGREICERWVSEPEGFTHCAAFNLTEPPAPTEGTNVSKEPCSVGTERTASVMTKGVEDGTTIPTQHEKNVQQLYVVMLKWKTAWTWEILEEKCFIKRRDAFQYMRQLAAYPDRKYKVMRYLPEVRSE